MRGRRLGRLVLSRDLDLRRSLDRDEWFHGDIGNQVGLIHDRRLDGAEGLTLGLEMIVEFRTEPLEANPLMRSEQSNHQGELPTKSDLLQLIP